MDTTRIVCTMFIRVRSLWGKRGIGFAMGSVGRARQPRPGASAAPPAIIAPGLPAQQRPEEDDYDFLVGSVADADALELARAEAARCGVATQEALLALGLVSATGYAAALARALGVPLAGWEAVFDVQAAGQGHGPQRRRGAEFGDLEATVAGRPCRVLCAEGTAPGVLRRRIAQLHAHGIGVALATRFRIDAALDEHRQAQRMDRAIHGLLRRYPVDSAGGTMVWTWQRVAAIAAALLIAAGLATAPDTTLAALTAMAAVPFLCVVLLRTLALREIAFAGPAAPCPEAPPMFGVADEEAPVYSVLVPLYREAGVLPGLVRALHALDYPRAKLEVLLVLEAADLDTQAALLSLRLPPGFRTVVVPDGGPRTKPKALNYALQFARGEYVVVYDAEDRPQPDQLRRALAMFRRGPPQLGCVQAQLNIHNPRASWFTRQFTVEYSALFDAILPALVRLGQPVPLGGTSNHFRHETLLAVGGWDPFNVTEDADLGFRLARRGWGTAVLPSTTWEEAPVNLSRWFKQRTRWLKGWMQTYLVHTRQPWRLGAELGLRGALGFHALMGGLVLLALMHPLFYALLAYHAASGQLLAPAAGALWVLAWVNLAAGYLTSMAVGAASARRRGQPDLVWSVLSMPLCWLLVSAAAYRALWQLATDPYLWEKTEHGDG
jgi:cellulose synthase/poly-beta-1,6-N-acetylglucosamine synthase-like glycosyltransferase